MRMEVWAPAAYVQFDLTNSADNVLSVGDVNNTPGDGLEILIIANNQYQLWKYRDGLLSNIWNNSIIINGTSSGVIKDVNGDGLSDLIFGAYKTYKFAVLHGNGTGFDNPVFSQEDGEMWDIWVGDLDGDSKNEIACGGLNGYFRIYKFENNVYKKIYSYNIGNVTSIAAGNYDADASGKKEIAVFTYGSTTSKLNGFVWDPAINNYRVYTMAVPNTIVKISSDDNKLIFPKTNGFAAYKLLLNQGFVKVYDCTNGGGNKSFMD